MKKAFNQTPKLPTLKQSSPRWRGKAITWLALLCGSGLLVVLAAGLLPGPWSSKLAVAQAPAVQKQEDQIIRDFTLPPAPAQPPVYQPAPAPVYNAPAPAPDYAAPAPGLPDEPPTAQAPTKPNAKPAKDSETAKSEAGKSEAGKSETGKSETGKPAGPSSQYVLEFNRSPSVGNRLRLEGVYGEARLGFTRPDHWKLQSVKALVRYQHSPALLASRSNLTVRVNGTSVGSTPLNQKDSQIGEFLVDVPTKLIQDANEISVVAQQNNDKNCSNAADPSLWTEVLPDSKLTFNYVPQAIALDFSRFPYPFFDPLSLDPNRLTYVQPAKPSDSWLTAAARFQTMIGRTADFRPLETRLVKDLSDLKWNDRVIMIGTPADQPLLASLKLPFPIADGKILDGKKQALPADVGVLMMAASPNGGNPVLVASGNGPEGVAKAVQYLVQPDDRKTATGQAMLIPEFKEAASPAPRAWKGHLPLDNNFKLSALTGVNGQPFQDVTVRGSTAPPINIDFRALPDDRFIRGNVMNLVFSYSAQANPRTSTVDVLMDGVTIASKRLTSKDGGNRETFNVNLPENLIKPTSKLQVAFRLNPLESDKCGIETDQQLSGTVHSDTNFKLNRENSVQLPDLALLSVGFPFAAPQDLSNTAIVVPDAPSSNDLQTLLEFSARVGRLSQADSVKVNAYTTATLPEDVRNTRNLVSIGLRDKFPLPDAFKPEAKGFALGHMFSRQWNQDQVVTLPDNGGVIKQIISPWNKERVLLALSSQSEPGLKSIQTVLNRDLWFYQLKGDTVLINANKSDAPAYDPNAYRLEFLQQSTPRRIEDVDILSKTRRFLQENWFMLPTGIVTLSLVLYGIMQLFLKRMAGETK